LNDIGSIELVDEAFSRTAHSESATARLAAFRQKQTAHKARS